MFPIKNISNNEKQDNKTETANIKGAAEKANTVPEQTDKDWLQELEEKVKTLKNLEEERQQKKLEQEEALKKIEALKEELANQQMIYEKSGEELERLEQRWVEEKELLVELSLR